jgi:hypothetical protein
LRQTHQKQGLNKMQDNSHIKKTLDELYERHEVFADWVNEKVETLVDAIETAIQKRKEQANVNH